MFSSRLVISAAILFPIFRPLDVQAGLRIGPPVEVFVDQTAIGNADGTSWADAFTTLQAALATANKPGSVVRVAEGTYFPDQGSGNRTLRYMIPNGITVEGGYGNRISLTPGEFNPSLYQTVLSGNIGNQSSTVDNSFHVVEVTNGPALTTLRFLTIQDGAADGGFPDDRGSGIRLTGGSVRVEDCFISHNSGQSGGAVDLNGSITADFVDCSFLLNTTTSSGGAINASGGWLSIIGCSFDQNSAEISGGAIACFSSNCDVVGSIFNSNSAAFFGGGFYHFGGDVDLADSTFTSNLVINSINVVFDGGGGYYNDTGLGKLKNCVFQDNLTGDDGGAILNHSGTCTIDRCMVRKNWSGDRGGGGYFFGGMTTLRNSGFIGNSSVNQGGAIHNNNSNSNVINCTVVLNNCNGIGGGFWTAGSSPSLNSSILWSNFDSMGSGEPAQIKLASGSVQVNYCCVAGLSGMFGGIGNLNIPPALVDADGYDNIPGTPDDNIHLKKESPCLNAGDPGRSILPGEQDVDAQPRRMGCLIDVGADEFNTGGDHTGDMDGNGIVNGRDVQLFQDTLLDIAPPGFECVADIDANTFVDFIDLDLFVNIAVNSP